VIVFDFVGTALRVAITYVYILLLVRLSGKRSIKNATVLDFIVVLIVGDLFDNAYLAQSPYSDAVVAMSVVVILHALTSYLTWRSNWLHKLIVGQPTFVVSNGDYIDGGLRESRMTREEVESVLRTREIEHLNEVKSARVELNGRVSVILREDCKPVPNRLSELLERDSS
jgi:uncharacterized membrane protein YcaP (DUF421 family)